MPLPYNQQLFVTTIIVDCPNVPDRVSALLFLSLFLVLFWAGYRCPVRKVIGDKYLLKLDRYVDLV